MLARVSTWTAVALLLSVASPAQDGDFLPAESLRKAGLVKFWQVRVPLAPSQSIRNAYLVDDHIYLGTNDGMVFAVHAYTGAIRWAQAFTTGGYDLWRPTHVGQVTVITTPPDVTQFDRHYGRSIRRTELRFPAGAPAVSDDRFLLIGSLNRRMYAMHPQNDFETWKVLADAEIDSRAAVWREFLYFATNQGTVYACESDDKRFTWRVRLGGSISAELVVDENGVYVANRDRSLYLIDAVFGGVRWRTRLNSALEEAPVVTPDTAYQYSTLDGVVAINVAALEDDDRIKWRFKRGRKALTQVEDAVWLLTADGQLATLDAASGALKHEMFADGFTLAMPSMQRPAVMLAHRDGRVFCAQSVDQPFVTAEDVRLAMRPGRPTEPQQDDGPRRPEAQLDDEDFLGTRDGQKPIGGKSGVSRGFGGER